VSVGERTGISNVRKRSEMVIFEWFGQSRIIIFKYAIRGHYFALLGPV
jgi:hypothetical protein